jgi:hypothetical protein
MKITIEASDPTSYMGKGRGRVVVDTGHDAESAREVAEAMRRSMAAYGFEQSSVDHALIEYAHELSELYPDA